MTDGSQDRPTKPPNRLLIQHWIQKGIKFQNAGKFQKALSCFVLALELNPDQINIWYRVGNCWQNLGYFEDAIAFYNVCYQRSLLQQNTWLQTISQLCLGQCYVSLQQQDQAIIAYRLAYQLFSQFENTPYTQQTWDYLDKVGNELLNNQQFDSAIQYYQSLLEVVKLVNNPQNLSSVLLNLGKAYYWQNQDELAIECHRQMLEISQGLSDVEMENTALQWLTCETWRLGQWESAIAYFKQRLGVIQRLQRPQEQLEILDWIIKGYKQLNQLENTIDYYQQILGLLREKQNFIKEYETLYVFGDVYFNLKEYSLAIDCFQQALNLETSLENPYHHGNINYMLGLIYDNLSQSSEAIASFEKAVAVYEQQENSQKWVIRASESLEKLYQQTEDFEKLIAILEKRLTRLRESEDRSNEYSLLYQIADLYYQLKNYSQAFYYYQSALEVALGFTEKQPLNQAYAYFMSGLMCHYLGQVQEGLENYRSALKLYTKLNNQKWINYCKHQMSLLEESQIYFLLNVLQATVDSNGDPEVVYPLLRKNLDLLNENLIPKLQQWATERFSLMVNLEESINLAKAIEKFGILILNFTSGNRRINLEIIITCYEICFEVIKKYGLAEDWAMTQIRIGRAYFQRIEGQKEDNIQKSIICYQTALPVFTKAENPDNWAIIQYLLGLSYHSLYQENIIVIENREKAITAYEAAITVFSPENNAEKWAETQGLLGCLYLRRTTGDIANNIEKAIDAYQLALTVYTQDKFREKWAETQDNIGTAYNYRIRGDKADNKERAIAAHQAALSVYSQENKPEQWALCQLNLGNAYADRVVGKKADNLEKSIAACEAASTIFTYEKFPDYWCGIQNNLGEIYKQRIFGKREDNLKKSLEACHASLLLINRGTDPRNWGRVNLNLGDIYSRLSDYENQEKYLELSRFYYESALVVFNHESDPERWATTQSCLTNVYRRIGSNKKDNHSKVIQLYKNSLQVFTQKAFPEKHAETLFGLGIAYFNNQDFQGAYDAFAQAIDAVDNLRYEITSGDQVKRKLNEQWFQLYQLMVEVCIKLKRYDKALEYADRSKARNLVELLATRDLYPKGDIPQTVLDELDRLRRDIETEQRRLEIQERTRNSFTEGTTGERSANITALQTPPPDRSRLNQLRQKLDDLITRDIIPIDPEFLLTQKVQPIPFSDIQALTGENTAILEWYILSDRFVVFIVTPENPGDPPLTPPWQRGEPENSEPPFLRGAGGIKPSELSEDPPLTPPYQREPENSEPPFLRGAGGIKLWQSTPEDYKALIAWADDYLTAYRTNKQQWQNTLTARLQRLGEILHFDQLLNAIGKCDRLVLIPNRFLHLFPLHALPISQDLLQESTSSSGVGARRASPLQESVILMDLFSKGVSYAPSCQLLQTAKNRQRPNFSQLFAIQNPTKDLAYTDLEVNSICNLPYFNSSHILVHENATKSTFNLEQQTTLKTANCHHFSCHGYFNFENPILSALLFANCYLEPAPSPLDPSRHLRLEKGQTLDLSQCLTLGDVFTLDLRSCRLVTLSACETGLIDFQSNSDEYIGLPSGFLVAGSTNVVSSLWAVSDISTALLMIRFYQLLQEGEEVAIALNYAQKWLRNATKTELLNWIDLGNKMQLRQSLKQIKDDEKPFASPYYWGAFCAIGK